MRADIEELPSLIAILNEVYRLYYAKTAQFVGFHVLQYLA
jgi:hypothetical protein